MTLLQRYERPFYGDEHRQFAATLREFVTREIEPFVAAWEERKEFPRELYARAAEVGLLPVGFPEDVGGVPADLFHTIVAAQELARAGSGGLSASLMSHVIGLPPIVRHARPELRARVAPEVLAGRRISALAITEPSAGSDVASIQTTAQRRGDHYLVNGSKTFITSGMRADFYTVAVRTGGPGHGGISLLVVERGTPGFSQTPLEKMGWWCSDTATLYFEDCRVPAENLLGRENEGFRYVMENFNSERIYMAAGCNGFSLACLEEAVAYARERKTFGTPLVEKQALRHRLVDMAMRIQATQAYLETLAARIEAGEKPVADICMLKNQATLTMEHCAREAVQMLGGAGYLRGPKCERIYREVRVNAIGGGAEEIMRELAARQLGL